MARSTQLSRGVVLASLAALLFGITAPLLQRASAGVTSLVSGALLYAGAALGAALLLLLQGRGPSRRLGQARNLSRLGLIALVGAVAAPVLLVMGLRQTDAATASLLLALEAPITLLLAWLLLGEHVGRRVLAAAALILGGGLLLGAGAAIEPTGPLARGAAGPLFIVAACAAWAIDNLLSRELADEDPIGVVLLKGVFGATVSGAAAALAGQAFPALGHAGALLLIGAFGYGISLQLYLRAQTLVGAARTASVFATAPFIGAAVALLLGSPWPGWSFPAAAALMVAGVVLHISERHGHPHTHEPLEHEHMHSHDDGHHLHSHLPMPAGPHSHFHRHDALTHEHEHSEDLHHRHRH